MARNEYHQTHIEGLPKCTFNCIQLLTIYSKPNRNLNKMISKIHLDN
jgi:hypothetical protein